MRKSGMLIVGLAVLTAALFTGCEEVSSSSTPTPIVSQKTNAFKLIEDPSTGILYIDNKFHNGEGWSCHVYTPYYSSNGKLCKYEDNEIVEVKDNEDETY